MRGYTGSDQLFHETLDCDVLTGDVTSLPETLAMKWDLSFCPVCFPERVQAATEERRYQ